MFLYRILEDCSILHSTAIGLVFCVKPVEDEVDVRSSFVVEMLLCDVKAIGPSACKSSTVAKRSNAASLPG